MILDLFLCSWRPYATFLERLLVEGVSPTTDPFRDFYHVIPSQVRATIVDCTSPSIKTPFQERENEWEDIIVETPDHLTCIKKKLCAIAFGFYVLGRTSNTALECDGFPGSPNRKNETWADLFLVRPFSLLGEALFAEEKDKGRPDDSHHHCSTPSQHSEWALLETQDRITKAVTQW